MDWYRRGDRQFLTKQFVAKIYADGLIVEAPKGGLIMGPSHSEGGVILFMIVGEEFEVVAEVEGWEFLANPFLTSSHQIQINNINQEFKGTDPFTSYDIPANVQIVDARPTQAGERKYLLAGMGAQWVINRHSTRKHLSWLDKVNKETWFTNAG